MPDILYSYDNGGYRITIFSDGTKIRNVIDPSKPPLFPEQMDLKITDWCDAGCAWCHEKSTKRGKHGDRQSIIDLLTGLPSGVEIAIGGGDPLSYPDFNILVKELRNIGLIPNVTVNGRHLKRHIKELEKLISDGLLFGVGVSYWTDMPDWNYEHKVIHMIAGVDSPEILDKMARQKILLLGYKNFGRGEKFKTKNPETVDKILNQWYRELFWVAKEHHISFDTLAITQLKPERLFKNANDYHKRFMGSEGEFSLYVDAVEKTYALSSYSKDRFMWTDIRGMYQHIRSLSKS